MKGVSFVTDVNDKKIAVQIDLKKYGQQLKPFLREVGISLEEDEDAFEKEWVKGIPLEQARQELLSHVRSFEWKKKK